MAGPVHDPALYRERDAIPVRRALISVSDKTGLRELAAALAGAGVEIVSTGSTAATIAEAGHAVTEVSAVTGFAETLDGRVKTLHPSVHAGILADLRLASHEAQLAELGIAPFDLVIVNLYPFVETVASGAEASAIVEQIDIGGPAMVRAAAKNHANVAIIVDPADYHQVTKAVTLGGTTLLQRQRFAAKAFGHTAAYDTAVAGWFADTLGVRARGAEAKPISGLRATPAPDAVSASGPAGDGSPATVDVHARLQQVLRYGENSHQSAALYRTDGGAGIAQATQLHGKEMSYNNYVDADAAVRAAYDHEAPAVAIIKHANPCGIAAGASIAAAHAAAHACDPVSAFGGVIAANRVVTRAAAESIAPIFTEVVVAPGFEPEARALLSEKKNIRLLELPTGFTLPAVELRQVSGGLLRQEADHSFAPASTWQLAAGEPADDATLADLEFAWRACRAVKSNAILLASGGASVGVGMGQVNRVDSCHLAVSRAGDRARGSVAASDAFFPFADGLQVLLDAGVRAIVQPGGSVRDEEVVAAAQAAGVTMYLTGERHFFH
ncbi:bifunctional phosphoribosylaminoimidazolecarboxamide formyltransferase/IMP cyclohydrolase [Chryseoglobus sp. 28M-23]|uniref:bifunctional phosphoribosylaminoimidazolecarboxamide formyltransferase/IMP cyclohydrolase n=1 Tax=Chryseoglobus sp. 28M-23 TaxID=2772253 RepID=UPI001746794D|nr:bifunctional phosphoribosylaminoimidazolecarboxamide formyltransferase/IMP cyclohydrolase [Chryseoglobus sp. 28M-23]QOD93932.1 bifunctional phosphoribosylaminoimidazolecarboxamide formyltransferase/IMP cyclohydrolase [Chryseoglobus sp. 28M-23]